MQSQLLVCLPVVPAYVEAEVGRVFKAKNLERSISKKSGGVWEMCQLVKCLPHKHEDLSLISASA